MRHNDHEGIFSSASEDDYSSEDDSWWGEDLQLGGRRPMLPHAGSIPESAQEELAAGVRSGEYCTCGKVGKSLLRSRDNLRKKRAQERCAGGVRRRVPEEG